MKKRVVWGYCRVSTLSQSLKRQIINIKEKYPDAVIITEEYTGTKMSRPEWNKLYPKLKKGDLIVFDSVSRMSRDAEEGFKVYKELYERGCELVFLKEPHINTEAYKEALKGSVNVDVHSGDTATDDLINSIMAALNAFMMRKVEDDIRTAFDQAEKEVQDLRQRVSEGLAVAKLNGKKLGHAEGDKLHVKKAEPIKKLIRKYSKDFDGTLNDIELLSLLKSKTVEIETPKRSGAKETRTISAGISRNSLYKYKREMKDRV